MPGHKGLYGPMGTGLLLCSGRYPLPSFIEGGTGSQSIQLMQPEELPEHLESGTLNLPGICGLRAGMETIEKKGLETIRRHEVQLVSRIYTQLKSCPGVRLYTTPQLLQTASPVLSFNIGGYTSEEVAAKLDRHGIAVACPSALCPLCASAVRHAARRYCARGTIHVHYTAGGGSALHCGAKAGAGTPPAVKQHPPSKKDESIRFRPFSAVYIRFSNFVTVSGEKSIAIILFYGKIK